MSVSGDCPRVQECLKQPSPAALSLPSWREEPYASGNHTKPHQLTSTNTRPDKRDRPPSNLPEKASPQTQHIRKRIKPHVFRSLLPHVNSFQLRKMDLRHLPLKSMVPNLEELTFTSCQ